MDSKKSDLINGLAEKRLVELMPGSVSLNSLILCNP